ncbi:MAG: hypothetical protein JST87_14835 [Bacteroidetes bacterium]|nr:hypothetical protein [Bacteroidota bacterium]
MSQEETIQKLLIIIVQKLGWGKSDEWQGKDFENLSIEILNSTGVSLSASTLKRIWGKVDYNHLPSMTTLDTLAKFAGYETWRNFQKEQTALQEKNEAEKLIAPEIPKQNNAKRWSLVLIILIVSLASIAAIWEMRKKGSSLNANKYSFGSEPLTHSIPNSVVFSYDASAAADSVFIQQSWDPSTRVAVKKDLHTYTSIYYEPGFYHAKLFVGNKIAKEHPLLIATTGWLGLIQNKPVPVYLKSSSFLQVDSINITIDEIKRNGIAVSPEPPVTKFYNVGNFDPVSIENFSFNVSVKNTYNEGSGVCQYTYIVLVTDAAPIIIPLAIKGCVSNLMLRNFDEVISGKHANLSGFGTDFSQWAKIKCKSANGKVKYYLNDKEIYQANTPSTKINIVGIGFYFQGTGAVKDIELLEKDHLVFKDFSRK